MPDLNWLRRRRMVRIWYGENEQPGSHFIGWFGRLLLRWECRFQSPGGPRRWEYDTATNQALKRLRSIRHD